jgi:hypothetical protein
MMYTYLQRQARLHVLLACCFVWMVSTAADADHKADSRSRARQAESSSYGTFSSQPVPLMMNHYLVVFIYSEFGETNVF